MWDERYSGEEYAFGTEPNKFLASVAHKIRGKKVLSLADGEGRNGVYLAEQGYEVLSVDSSKVGIEKACKLAASRGVSLNTLVMDLADYQIAENSWDAIIYIFCHLPSELRQSVFRQVCAGLTPGGLLILEAYSPEQLKYNTGGPRTRDRLLSLVDAERELAGLEFLTAEEKERVVLEGLFHSGKSAVTQLVARKPA